MAEEQSEEIFFVMKTSKFVSGYVLMQSAGQS